jgi:probable H4MPT-linked C1 transfer pathway protein
VALTAGYDVGGAHLKIAVSEDGRVRSVMQVPCPLWNGIGEIDLALAAAAPMLRGVSAHAATMTGELCEIFPDRVSGVQAILDRLADLLGDQISIWMGKRGLGTIDAARASPLDVASTNFLASAAFVATKQDDALLVDMGSTTTDIIPIVGGTPVPRGLSDGDRLRSGELVYTGLTRTDVSSVARRASLEGIEQRLTAGGFANMADVRRVIDDLPDDVDQHATLDGRGKSEAESLERFARCFGRDAVDAAPKAWQSAAREIISVQLADVQEAIGEVLAATNLPATAPIITAGIGAPQIEQMAPRHGHRTIPFGALVEAGSECATWATRCAPATALAILAQR